MHLFIYLNETKNFLTFFFWVYGCALVYVCLSVRLKNKGVVVAELLPALAWRPEI